MTTNVFVNNMQPPPPPPPQPPTLIAVQSNQWSTGICDCFDDLYICCCGLFCFPCLTCVTASDYGECFCLPLLDILGISVQMFGAPCTQPVSMSMRVAVRSRYGIQGDMTSDCVYSTFCNICSWCQIARELKRRKMTLAVVNAQPARIIAPEMRVLPAVVTT